MRASTRVVSTLSNNLSSLHYTYSQSAPTSLFASATSTDRLRCPLGSRMHAKVCDCVWPQPLNEADTTMMTYPTTSKISANHLASGDSSVISPCRLQQKLPLTLEINFQALTVSGINDFFSSLLLWFISSFLVPDRNKNEWRRLRISWPPTPYLKSPPPEEACRVQSIPLPNCKQQGGCCA